MQVSNEIKYSSPRLWGASADRDGGALEGGALEGGDLDGGDDVYSVSDSYIIYSNGK